MRYGPIKASGADPGLQELGMGEQPVIMTRIKFVRLALPLLTIITGQ